MVNTMGMKKEAVIHALESYAGCKFSAAKSEPGLFLTTIKCEMVIVDLRHDDGFSEFWYDRACGQGAAQKAIDELRMKGERKPGENWAD